MTAARVRVTAKPLILLILLLAFATTMFSVFEQKECRSAPVIINATVMYCTLYAHAYSLLCLRTFIERLNGAEIYIGDVDPKTGNATANKVCDEPQSDDDIEQPQIMFQCSTSRGRYLIVRLPEAGVPLTLCEVLVFSNPTEPTTILDPHLNADGSCPDPLDAACKQYEEEGMNRDDAAVKAFMEGPVDCGDMGFFCMMQQDPAGITGGVTGTPGDQFINNRNFGFW